MPTIFSSLDDLAQEVRHAARLLRRNPVFAAVAVVSLAIGIGANCAIFSLADVLILAPLPVRDPAAIVTIGADLPDEGFIGGRMSYPNYRDLRDSSQSFDGLVAFQLSTLSFAPSREIARETRMGMLVSDNFFTVLDVRPAVGRSFTAEETRVPGRDAIVVLAYDFWKNVLASDESILNHVVWINGIDFHVVGVAPPQFTGTMPPVRPAFYIPVTMAQRLKAASQDPLENRQAYSFDVKGRLKSGVARRAAQAELATLWRALEQQYPDANRNRRIAVRTELEERIRQDPWDTVLLATLGALVAIVLIIACANVANLMLGRVRSRSREVAIRLALGISRPRLVRQLIVESFVLAIIGCALGLVFAYGGIRFLNRIPVSDPVVIAPQLDLRVLVVGLMAAAFSALIFGVAPARHALKTDLVPALKATEPGEAARRRMLGRNALVVAQIAAAMVLLIATGILLDGFRKAVVLDPGFRTDRLLMMSLDTSLVRYTPAQTRVFYRELLDRARALAGVASAALTSSVPFRVGDERTEAVIPEGYKFAPGQENVATFAAIVDEQYFSTMGIPVVRGRAFTAADWETSRRVAIVNEEFARTYWRGQEPIGRRIRLNDSRGPWLEIVGMTRTAKYTWIAEQPMPFLYLPFAQNERTRMSLIVESKSADPSALAAPLRDVVRTIDLNQPVFNVRTLSNLYRERVFAVPLLLMQTVGTIGALGATMALIGLYALIAYSVARRTREIGIRMAIGAGKSDVLRMVLRDGLMLSGAGIVAGAAASVAAARLLAAELVGLGTPNPATYAIVPAVLIGLTMAASYLPARRASLVDPLVALRYE